MGVPIQVTLDVPIEIASGLAAGTLVRHAGVVRDLGGRVVRHLPEISREPSEELAKVGSRAIKAWTSGPRPLILITAAVAGVGIGALVANQSRSRKLAKALNASLSAYLTAARGGMLSVVEIDQLVADLDAAKEVANHESVVIDVQLNSVLDDFTARLAEANAAAIEPASGRHDVAPLVHLRDSLEVQRRILSDAVRGGTTV